MRRGREGGDGGWSLKKLTVPTNRRRGCSDFLARNPRFYESDRPGEYEVRLPRLVSGIHYGRYSNDNKSSFRIIFGGPTTILFVFTLFLRARVHTYELLFKYFVRTA